MQQTRIHIDRLEFYITNVCNLTCNGCNRYNNYNFKGWQRWEDYESILEEWSKKITIGHPVILGGEPLLNADIAKWVKGLRKLWPEYSGVQIQSNGTMIDRAKGLYEALDPAEGNWIGISIHNPADKDEIFKRIHNFLGEGSTMTANSDDPIGSDYQFTNKDKHKVHAWMSDKFVNSNIIKTDSGRFELYNSDPDVAHENCTFRRFKNYHMIKGKIYKCGPSALMPEFDDQFKFNISDEDRQLLHSYQPLSVEEFDERGLDFLHNIDSVIPQCKFCPEKYTYSEITFADTKKPWYRAV